MYTYLATQPIWRTLALQASNNVPFVTAINPPIHHHGNKELKDIQRQCQQLHCCLRIRKRHYVGDGWLDDWHINNQTTPTLPPEQAFLFEALCNDTFCFELLDVLNFRV